MTRPLWLLLGLAAVGGCVSIYLISIPRTPVRKSAPPPIPVMAASAQAKDVPIILRGLGTVTAFNSVALRSRVEGNITAVNFIEGQNVKTGDLLIQLDPRPYQAALDQAKANVTRDTAALNNAKIDLDRYADLLKRNFAPEQQVATQKTTVAQDQASIDSDQAAIKAAALNLDYSALRSPIDGVTGIRQVDIGNLIQANSQQTLVTITQIEPIYVVFTLPEADIDRVRQAMTKGVLSIQAFDPEDRRKIAEGTLVLIDNAVDQSTGTVKLKAEFKNSDRALWPGQFVNAHVVLETVRNGVTVPTAAVLTGPKGTFAYVVAGDNRVALRPVTVEQTDNNSQLISAGLTLGERVVTAGQFRLQPGATVRIASQIADRGQTLSDAPAGTQAAQ